MTQPFRLEPIDDHGLAWLRFEQNEDKRGWLSEVFNQQAASELGLPVFGQDNVSHSCIRGLVRGLHFQRPVHAQAKLFRVVSGRVFNVAVDLRPEQFGSIYACEMSAGSGAWIYIPVGYAHGFQVLDDAADVHYKVTQPFRFDARCEVAFDDPALGVAWPLHCPRLLLSDRDRGAAGLEAARSAFLSIA